MQFSQNIDGFRQNDSQGFWNSYNPINKTHWRNFFIFAIYQNYLKTSLCILIFVLSYLIFKFLSSLLIQTKKLLIHVSNVPLSEKVARHNLSILVHNPVLGSREGRDPNTGAATPTAALEKRKLKEKIYSVKNMEDICQHFDVSSSKLAQEDYTFFINEKLYTAIIGSII